jgi:two-component system chemotaxis sensor kinase CheA
LSIAGKEKNQNNFIEEFLDDYFAESEEHLIVLRRALLELEQFVNRLPINRALLDELFRSFHSLKGISGMVGLREAEQLSHQMESYLRILRDEQGLLTVDGFDALIEGTKVLEQVISFRRQDLPMPDISPVSVQLEEVILNHSPTESPRSVRPAELESDGNQAAIATSDNKKLWRFTFMPLPALAERGININLVRSRLKEIGELRNSVPQVLPGGGIAFEFIVASSARQTDLLSFQELGLTYEAVENEEINQPEAAHPEPISRSESTAHPTITSSQIVRVNLSRLDDLMHLVGELVISRSRLEENLKQSETDMPATHWRSLQETNQLMERQLRDLREGVMRVRMVPVGEIFERMRFVVRDLSREYGKKVELELTGGDTEIDKLLIERMADPLMHLVRNAISHGLETPAERESSGKSATGMIRLRAFTAAEAVVLEVIDDGRGLDRQRVGERGRSLGLPVPEHLDDAALLDLICTPGLSTREEADRASGRGVGMAVVQKTILALGGTFTLETEVGRGTRFAIQLPITLAIAEALLVTVGNQTYVVPQSAVREVIEVEPEQVKTFENNQMIPYRGGVLPIIRLADLFALQENYQRAFHVFVIGTGLQAAGVAVDRILGQREIVVRAINDPLIQIPGFAGATELGDGRVVLILDPVALIKRSTFRRNKE